MSIHGDDSNPSSTDISKQQMKFLTQLFRMMPTFKHIDELFQWLAYTIAQQYNAQLIQFWAHHTNTMGQHIVQLRTMVCQNTSLPRPLVASDDVALIAQQIAYEQRIYSPQTIDRQFPQYRASVLRRHGLNFFAACYFIYTNLFLPPASNDVPAGTPTPLTMTIMLFLSQQSHFDPMPSIITVMNQAMSVAGTRGLLLPMARGLAASRMAPEQELPPLEKLILHRKQNSDLMLSSNPLSRSIAITDRSARRLYSVINGQSDMVTLCRRADMSMSEAYTALQILLTQQRIEVRSASGILIDASFLA
jgi:hypothetical protein